MFCQNDAMRLCLCLLHISMFGTHLSRLLRFRIAEMHLGMVSRLVAGQQGKPMPNGATMGEKMGETWGKIWGKIWGKCDKNRNAPNSAAAPLGLPMEAADGVFHLTGTALDTSLCASYRHPHLHDIHWDVLLSDPENLQVSGSWTQGLRDSSGP